MINLLLGSKIAQIIGVILATIAAVLGIYTAGRKSGKDDMENDALKETAKKLEDGRDAVNDLRGADRDKLNKRLHDNDKRW